MVYWKKAGAAMCAAAKGGQDMETKKQDVRITKTQRSLVQALLALLENQSFAKITINDICNEAMVSRSTFYAHFEDKYRLLEFSLRELNHRVFADAQETGLRELLVDILDRMQQNAKTLRNLLVAELDIELIEMFRQHFIAMFQNMLERRELAGKIPVARVEVVASFYAAGVSQTIALWIAKKLPISTEEMADILYEMMQGLERRQAE